MGKNLAILAIILLPLCRGLANNITVTNMSLHSQNAIDETVVVQFDLSWENSFRFDVGPQHYDAAWVFVKVKVGSRDFVQSARLNYVDGANDGHQQLAGGTPATIQGTSDGLGVYIYRSAAGNGTFSGTFQLLWDYGANGITEADELDVDVFAVEMVYVPEGPFYLGDGSGTGFFRRNVDEFLRPPFQITSANSFTVGDTGAVDFSSNNGSVSSVSALGSGFSAFYCMKYEISEGQFEDFAQNLTISDRQEVNVPLGTPSATPDEAKSLSAPRLLAYLDWATLRPMTEFEYEKACRGPRISLPNEYAWGNRTLHASPYIVNNAGQSNAVIANNLADVGHALYDLTSSTVTGPYRCGIFAASTINGTRQEAGASYYGIMELSGNLFEIAHDYTRTSLVNGNGVVNSDLIGGIFPLVGPWRYLGEVVYRGGGYNSASTELRVSDRNEGITVASSETGGRGVRSAP